MSLLGCLRKFRVWQLRRIDQFRECIPENVFILPIVKPMFKLIQIGVQMFDTDLMIRADNRPLQEAPNALDAVSMNIADNPFLCGMINPTMLRIGVLNSPIGWHFIGIDRFCVGRGVCP